ncbi:MAG: ABC transporter permease [Spirochaetales bacterium]|nr:ABC transporter permease [Spirochaetales bacterium]
MNTYVVAWRNIGRNKRRTALSAVAITVAAFGMVLLFSIIAGLSFEMQDNFVRYITGDILIEHEEFEKYQDINPLHFYVPDQEELIKKMEALEGVAHAFPRINFGGQLYSQASIGEFKRVSIFGFDPVAESDTMNMTSHLVPETNSQMPAANSREVIISEGLAKREGLKVGDKINLATMTVRRAAFQITMKISGIAYFDFSQMNEGIVFIPFDLAQYIVDYSGFDGAMSVNVVKKTNVERGDLEKQINDVLKTESAYQGITARAFENVSTIYSFLKMAEYIYYFMGLLFFLLASTVIINTTMMVIFERTREIGTLSALGMKGKEIVRLFFTEALIIAIIGSLVGVVIGTAMAIWLEPTGFDFKEAMQGVDFQISGMMKPKWNPVIAIFVLAAGIVVSSFAAYFPAKRASRIKPIEAMRKDY